VLKVVVLTQLLYLTVIQLTVIHTHLIVHTLTHLTQAPVVQAVTLIVFLVV